jgi:hypothetical protein
MAMIHLLYQTDNATHALNFGTWIPIKVNSSLIPKLVVLNFGLMDNSIMGMGVANKLLGNLLLMRCG